MNLEKIISNICSKKSFLCVGLDPVLELMPKHLLQEDDPVFQFNKYIKSCFVYKKNSTKILRAQMYKTFFTLSLPTIVNLRFQMMMYHIIFIS